MNALAKLHDVRWNRACEFDSLCFCLDVRHPDRLSNVRKALENTVNTCIHRRFWQEQFQIRWKEQSARRLKSTDQELFAFGMRAFILRFVQAQ